MKQYIEQNKREKELQRIKAILIFSTITVTIPAILLLPHATLIGTENGYYAYAIDNTIIPDFNFAAVGDWGCTDDTRDTVKNIIDSDPELVLGLGDYSYNRTAECWLEIVDPIDHKMKIAIGNHEHSFYSDSGPIYPSPKLLQEYLTHFNLSKQFYSFNYRNIHFLAISTEVPFENGSEQYNYVKSDLEKTVNDSDINWIVVFFHRLAYTSPASLDSIPILRNTYHPLFEKYDVDVVMQGHGHNYQRTLPIVFSQKTPTKPLITSDNKSYYDDPRGQIFTVVGTGGTDKVHNFTGPAANYMAIQFKAHGYLNIDSRDNGTKLIGIFLNNNGSVNDKFTIDK